MHYSFFSRTRLVRVLALIGLLILSGCSTVRPWQNRAAQPGTIRTQESALQATIPPPSIVVVVALSGGGSRAAAFGLGVLQEMNATHFSWEGKPTNLLERLSAISGVSGGSVLAAYYAAFGAEGLNEFEADFLLKDIQGDFISQAISSATAYRLTSPWFGRSNAFAEQLDKLYKGKTYGDVAGRKGAPELLIAATDLTTGAPFEFSPEQFRLICSDLSSVPLAFAVASSSAIPFVLTPTSLRNQAAGCAAPALPIVEATQSDAHNASTSYRRQLLDRSAASYLNAEERPFIHLVDGGLADNLGVRILLDRVVASGSIKNRFRESPPGSVRKIVLIVVNSERDMVDRIDQSDKVPSTAQVIDALVFGAGSRSTQETMAALNDGVSGWADKIAQSRGERNSPFSADAEIHVIPVSLHDVDDRDVRRLLLQVPTAFTIEPRQVSQLVESGRSTLRTSPAFQRLVKDLQQKSCAEQCN